MISYYELLGLIKECKQPERVIYEKHIYIYDGDNYYNDSTGSYLIDSLISTLSDIDLANKKNIEIIEDKPNQILELDYKYKNTYGRVSDHKHSELEIIDKVNELTKAVNYLLEDDKHE